MASTNYLVSVSVTRPRTRRMFQLGTCMLALALVACGEDQTRDDNGQVTDTDTSIDAADTSADAAECVTDQDCAASEVCTEGLCAGAGCTDGVMNGDETAADCGGPDCSTCPDGSDCFVPEDCASMVCDARVCLRASCSDGVQNGTEGGIDCGGECLTACEVVPDEICNNEIDDDGDGAVDCEDTDCADFCGAGACDADERAMLQGDDSEFQDALSGCGFRCATSGTNTQECAMECILDDTEIQSEACAGCAAASLLCQLDRCFEECLGDFRRDECVVCSEPICAPEFRTCAGI